MLLKRAVNESFAAVITSAISSNVRTPWRSIGTFTPLGSVISKSTLSVVLGKAVPSIVPALELAVRPRTDAAVEFTALSIVKVPDPALLSATTRAFPTGFKVIWRFACAKVTRFIRSAKEFAPVKSMPTTVPSRSVIEMSAAPCVELSPRPSG